MYESPEFVVKATEKKDSFDSGMSRSEDGGRIDYTTLVNGPMFDRWAEHMTKGAVVHPDVDIGTPNWMLADSEEELWRAKKSAFRHFRAWLEGKTDEDHAAALFFNVNMVEYIEGRLTE